MLSVSIRVRIPVTVFFHRRRLTKLARDKEQGEGAVINTDPVQDDGSLQ
jgi:hypothetical protein